MNPPAVLAKATTVLTKRNLDLFDADWPKGTSSFHSSSLPSSIAAPDYQHPRTGLRNVQEHLASWATSFIKILVSEYSPNVFDKQTTGKVAGCNFIHAEGKIPLFFLMPKIGYRPPKPVREMPSMK
jgi:hypothetical protein